MENKYNVLIIGGGIIGTSIAYQLSKSKLSIIQFEKNNYLADETSMGNSGLIHSGIDAEGKIESVLNLEGNKIWRNEILKNIEIPNISIPSLILAFNDKESEAVDELYARGIRNKLDKDTLKILTKEEIIELEPNINRNVVKGVLATSSVAIDPVIATRNIAAVANKNGCEIKKGSEVTNIEFENDHWKVTINNKDIYYADYVVNAAGHYADLISNKVNNKKFDLVAKRGEYRILSKSEASKVNKHVIFKVPTIHGKGVIVAPMLDGRLLIGPTAEDGIKKEDTRLITQEMYDHIGKIGHDLIPSLNLERTEKTYSGSRPIYKETNDFLIEYGDKETFINVAGTQSPALSSAPAIANVVEKMLIDSGLDTDRKEDFDYKINVMW